MKATRGQLADWASNQVASVKEFDNLRGKKGQKVLETIQSEANGHSSPATADVVEELVAAVEVVSVSAKELSLGARMKAIVDSHRPVFIYFENYGVLDSAVYLPRLIQDIQNTPSDARVRTINAMFKHVKLTAKEILDLGREEVKELEAGSQPVTPEAIENDKRRKELRAIKLNSASLDITNRFSDWWKQRRHEVRYHADGSYFRIWVADDRRPGVEIELESRSKGFQWFFSFYLVFLVESDEGHGDAILLLDEPGLNLHPTAQQELISFFEVLSETNQLMYTTHSPFLIDGDRLHRVRPVVEDDHGVSHISDMDWPADRDTIFPLQAAAGYAMMQGLLRHGKNVLVEGISDYLYLHAFSLLLNASGRASLPDDIYLVPCGGTRLVGPVASLFLADDIRPLILLDADEAGRGRQKSLLKELYAKHENSILLLSEPLAKESAEIEDAVGEEQVIAILGEVIGKAFTLAAQDRVAGSLPDQIEAAASRKSIVLPDGWRGAVAHRLVSRWAEQKPEELPGDFLDRAEAVVSAINNRFDEIDIGTAMEGIEPTTPPA